MSSRPTQTNKNKSPQDVDLKCSICGRPFTRNEHLKRHELIHSNDKPHQCHICGRDFVRKDALDRHVATHETLASSLRRTGGRACTSCAAAKAKCSGDMPQCLRCQKRGEARCIYPDATSASSVGHTSRLHAGMPMDPGTTSAIETMPGIQGGLSDEDIGMSNTELISQPMYSEPALMGQDAPIDWNDEFQSAINWISNEFPTFPDGFEFDDFNDNTLLPWLNTSPGVLEEVDSPTLHQQQIVSPRRRLGSWGSLQVSPQHVSNASLSSQGTPLSARTHTNISPRIEGELYVDGQPARLPRVKRRKLTPSSFVSTPNKNGPFGLSFDISGMNGAPQPGVCLPDGVYHQMFEAFNRVCIDQIDHPDSLPSPGMVRHTSISSAFPTRFEPGFPSKLVFEVLVHSYMTDFQPILPIIHPGAFHSLDWQLTLAVSVLGARLIALEHTEAQFPASLHEFLRRILYLGEEDITWLPPSLVGQTQTKLLFAINLAYTSTSQTWKLRHPAEHLPVSFCLENRRYHNKSLDLNLSAERRWEDWKNYETKIRLGNAIWLVDSLFAVHFQRKALLTLDNVPPHLPCHEELWHIDSADEWAEALPKHQPPGTMKDALYDIYVKKQLPAQMGEFSRILLIHGLFHRMWQVQTYFEQPLSHWTPTANKPADDTHDVGTANWLPAVPAFARWRNATCDCIDVLHWSANATIGAASGMEHPTVLHLHFSRIVLLTPYKCITNLAKYLAGTQPNLSEADNKSYKQLIRRWAIQDQYKARLAMIHAGVLLWHVRRYSANGFYEPSSVAMATLALWAFSIFSEKPQLSSNDMASDIDLVMGQDEPDEQEARCDIILLDRPTDDELVQQFVREGHRMRAILKGVGDLCGTNGPERVLIEGRKLLKTLRVWGVAEYWIGILDKLITVSRRQREQQPPNNGNDTVR